MAKRHLELVSEAREAIGKLYSDKSVSQATTLESMEELREFIDENIRALKDTMQDEDDLEADR